MPASNPHRIAAIVACGLVIAACGSSGTPSASSPNGGPALRFAECMRAHGISGFPDPRSGGGGIQIPDGSGINPFSPAFKAARASCRALLPGGGPGSQHPSAQDRAQMLQTSECMRLHGVSGFPDPTLSPPSSPAGYSAVMVRGGVVLAIPNTINVQSPAFKQAATACQFPH